MPGHANVLCPIQGGTQRRGAHASGVCDEMMVGLLAIPPPPPAEGPTEVQAIHACAVCPSECPLFSSPLACSLWKRSLRSFLRGARGEPGYKQQAQVAHGLKTYLHRVVNLLTWYSIRNFHVVTYICFDIGM